MDSVEYIKLKRKSFSERLEAIASIGAIAEKQGSMIGRVGLPPVDSIQKYKHPISNEFSEVIMMGSNNYLGLANEPEIKQKVADAVMNYGVGSGGSPAFSGFTQQQLDVEKRLAAYSSHESAVLISGGYMANLTWLTSLLEKDDVIIYDKNSHASVIDGIKLAGVRHAYTFDPDRVEMLRDIIPRALSSYPDSQLFLTVEGVRSIDGSVVDLKSVLDECAPYRKDIFIMLDDAHGLGTLGQAGMGTMEYYDLMGSVDLRMSTCSKAFGIQGAFLTASQKVVNYMRAMANSYNFTSATSQPNIAGISAAIDFLEEHPERIKKLQENKLYLQDQLEGMGYNIYRAPSGIIPIYIPGAPCDLINRDLYDAGLFLNVMSYPMIAPGQERMRISVMATHTRDIMDRGLDILQSVGKKHKII